MLGRRKQRKYLAKKAREWENQLQVFGRTHEGEALHHLRVAIKKIKAFARMASACSGNEAVRDSHLLKKMFRQAGAIRDAGNRLQLLEHFHAAPEEYKQEQQQRKETETIIFIDHIAQYRKKGRKAGRRLLADLHAIRKGRIRGWYARRIVNISVLLTASGERMHKARKQIKELLYVNGLLPSRLTDELALDKEYLDHLQEAIGQWHDATVVVASWAGKDLAGSQSMVRECHEKEAVVRRLADDFYLRAHVL
jgi:CHAD domain-containing protein